VLTKADSLDRDYTQKTQTLAEERKQVEAAIKAEFERLEQTKKYAKESAQVENLRSRVEAYKDIDWAAWAAQDPQAASKHQVIFNDLKRQIGEIEDGIRKRSDEETSNSRRARQLEIIKAQEAIREHIKDWGPELAKKITVFSTKELGIPMDQLNEMNRFPWAMRALHMAMSQHDSLVAAQPQNLPQPSPQPVPKVGGSAPGAKSPDQLSDAEWMKWRNQDIAKKRANGVAIR